ncbi:hypothetical protein MCERE10_01064 [Burkholderiaceae bacterium]
MDSTTVNFYLTFRGALIFEKYGDSLQDIH